MKIENSLDWSKVHTELNKQILDIGYNPDLMKMLTNIGLMVYDLSQLEVEARRTHKTNKTKIQVEKINNAIDHLEKLLIIAKLMN